MEVGRSPGDFKSWRRRVKAVMEENAECTTGL